MVKDYLSFIDTSQNNLPLILQEGGRAIVFDGTTDRNRRSSPLGGEVVTEQDNLGIDLFGLLAKAESYEEREALFKLEALLILIIADHPVVKWDEKDEHFVMESLERVWRAEGHGATIDSLINKMLPPGYLTGHNIIFDLEHYAYDSGDDLQRTISFLNGLYDQNAYRIAMELFHWGCPEPLFFKKEQKNIFATNRTTVDLRSFYSTGSEYLVEKMIAALLTQVLAFQQKTQGEKPFLVLLDDVCFVDATFSFSRYLNEFSRLSSKQNISIGMIKNGFGESSLASLLNKNNSQQKGEKNNESA